MQIEKKNINLLLHCKDSYFSDLTVWSICHTGTEKWWYIQNKHCIAMIQMEDWRSALYLKNSSNQASKSIDEFLMSMLIFYAQAMLTIFIHYFFPFSLLLIPM